MCLQYGNILLYKLVATYNDAMYITSKMCKKKMSSAKKKLNILKMKTKRLQMCMGIGETFKPHYLE